MQYKTIVLELIRHEYPALHDRLRRSRTLLSAMEDHAVALRRYHQDWIERLSQKQPGSDPSLIAGQAMELAMVDLRDDLPSASPPDQQVESSLAAAVERLRKPSPTA